MTLPSPPARRTPPPQVSVPGRPSRRGPDALAGEPDSNEVEIAAAEARAAFELEQREKLRTRRLGLTAWVSAIALGALVAFLTFGTKETVNQSQVNETVGAALGDAFSSTTQPPDRGPAIYGTVFPSLVFIEVEGNTGDSSSVGLGSGVIINADGSIMTSDHVVAGNSTITVTFTDGTTSAAVVTESFPEMDIAVLQTATLPDVVVPATFGGSPAIGSRVYAVGNPLGLSGSISTGIVSATGRTISREDGEPLEDLIQFDAAVNPGSSGGPLLDDNAQLIGIVTALVNPTGEDFFSGIGFAVPIQNAAGAAGGPQQ